MADSRKVWGAWWIEAAYGERWSYINRDEKKVREMFERLAINPLPETVCIMEVEL